jgi:hypothetical protein
MLIGLRIRSFPLRTVYSARSCVQKRVRARCDGDRWIRIWTWEQRFFLLLYKWINYTWPISFDGSDWTMESDLLTRGLVTGRQPKLVGVSLERPIWRCFSASSSMKSRRWGLTDGVDVEGPFPRRPTGRDGVSLLMSPTSCSTVTSMVDSKKDKDILVQFLQRRRKTILH